MDYAYNILTYSRNILPRRIKRALWDQILADQGILYNWYSQGWSESRISRFTEARSAGWSISNSIRAFFYIQPKVTRLEVDPTSGMIED